MEDAVGEGDENNKGDGENVDVDGEGDENNRVDVEVGDAEEAMGENDGEALFLCLFGTENPAFLVLILSSFSHALLLLQAALDID